jgi:hypothetical protein
MTPTAPASNAAQKSLDQQAHGCGGLDSRELVIVQCQAEPQIK